MPFDARKKEVELAKENNPAPAAGQWAAYIRRYTGNLQPIWRVVGFYHLTGKENAGKNNLFISALDENFNRVYSPTVQIEWGWEGQKPSEKPNNVILDKPLSEPMGNIALGAGQKVWIEVAGADGSDEIGGIHTGWDSDGAGNHRFHHSFFVVLQRNPGIKPPDPEPEPPKEPVTRTYHIEDDDFKIVLTVTSKP